MPDEYAGTLRGMRILALVSEFPPFRGGIGTYAYAMAQAATELGAEVTVLAPDYGAPGQVDTEPFRLIRYAGGQHSARQSLAKLRLAWSAIHRPGPAFGILHAMDWPFFIPVALCAGASQRRLFTLHGSEISHMGTKPKRLAIAAAGVFSRRSDIVTNSAYTLARLRQHFPAITPRSLGYQHLGVADSWRRQAERGPAARARLGLPSDKFVLLTVARLTRRKGQLQIIESLRLLPEKVRHGLAYVMVGPEIDAAYVAEVDAAAVRSDVQVVRLSGIGPEALLSVYANADAFCLVGQKMPDGATEGFGLVFLEAAAQRLPVIAGAEGAVEEVVLHDRTGLIVPPSDGQALAEAITRLMTDPACRERLANGAYARAESLSWRRCAAYTYAQPPSPVDCH
jgi:glycosyltransferase involved in cell wall biosynthesis